MYWCMRQLQASWLAAPKLCASLLRCWTKCHKHVCASVKVWRYSKCLAYRGVKPAKRISIATARESAWEADGSEAEEWEVKG